MSDTRTTLALPIDVSRLFDTTVTQAQLNANTFQNSGDDTDLLLSMIEDVEDEFHDATDDTMKLGTVGIPGTRETYEQPAYKISGHKLTKGTFTGVWTEYLPEQKTIPLEKERVLPFDPTEGDEIYIYRGLDDSLGDGWEDVTDERGTMWDILNHREGTLTFSPIETAEYLMDYHVGAVSGSVPSFIKRMRFAISYRYGGLGGSRSTTSETTLAADLADSETGTVGVTDGAGFPGTSEIIVKIGREYLSVSPNPDTDEMDILERGVRGTDAASHDADDSIQYTPPAVRKAVASRAAQQLVDSSRYGDWLPDTEDDIDKSDMADSFQATWDKTVSALA
jgi:hypothetical protein